MANKDSFMQEIFRLAIVAGIGRAMGIVAGVFCIYLGYRLFKNSNHQHGDLDAQANNWRLTFRRITPGAFFALLGTAIAIIAIVGFKVVVDTPESHFIYTLF